MVRQNALQIRCWQRFWVEKWSYPSEVLLSFVCYDHLHNIPETSSYSLSYLASVGYLDPIHPSSSRTWQSSIPLG